jgi:hypothetical protein
MLSETSGSLRTTWHYSPVDRTLHFIALFIRPEIHAGIIFDRKPEVGTVTLCYSFMILHISPSSSYLRVVKYWGVPQGTSLSPQGSPLWGSPDAQDTATEAREWEMAIECFVASFKYLVRTSQKTPVHICACGGASLPVLQ